MCTIVLLLLNSMETDVIIFRSSVCVNASVFICFVVMHPQNIIVTFIEPDIEELSRS